MSNKANEELTDEIYSKRGFPQNLTELEYFITDACELKDNEIALLKEENANYKSCLSEILTYKSPDYLKKINGETHSIFSLVSKVLKTIKSEERIESFHSGFHANDEKIKEQKEEITLLKERVKLLELIIIEFPMSHNKSFYRAVWEGKYKAELDSIRLKME